jgi:hypothetical protein
MPQADGLAPGSRGGRPGSSERVPRPQLRRPGVDPRVVQPVELLGIDEPARPVRRQPPVPDESRDRLAAHAAPPAVRRFGHQRHGVNVGQSPFRHARSRRGRPPAWF